MVGAAVGRALFASDAVAVMDLLVGQLQVQIVWLVCLCVYVCGGGGKREKEWVASHRSTFDLSID